MPKCNNTFTRNQLTVPQVTALREVVFMCAGGMRSLLATQTAQNMGMAPVANLKGGFAAWKEADGPVEKQ